MYLPDDDWNNMKVALTNKYNNDVVCSTFSTTPPIDYCKINKACNMVNTANMQLEIKIYDKFRQETEVVQPNDFLVPGSMFGDAGKCYVGIFSSKRA